MKSNRIILFVALFATVAAIACGGGSEPATTGSESAPPPAEPAAPAGPTGSIAGTVTYVDGDPDTAIAMDADPVCVSLHPDPVHTQQIVVNDGNLANVFVYVKEGVTGSHPAPSESKMLDQKGCQYQPHVSGIQVGQTLVIRNSDSTLHNVHAMPEKNAEFNNGQPFEGMELEHQFTVPEIMVPFKCDVHPWMNSYMGVLEHPFYAVSAEDGTFAIEGLPAGDYVVEAWHEELGAKTMSVTVSADAAAEASFDFSPAG